MTPHDDPEHAETGPTPLALAVGGWRGVVDGGLPVVVYVAVDALAPLRAALVAAVATAVVIAALRVVRHEPVRQAAYGVLAVVVAALAAARTHSSAGFFLPGIVFSAGYGLLALASVLVGHPLAGYAAAALDRDYANWRADRRLRRAASRATLVWAGVFAVRALVQGLLYLQGQAGWLAAARLAMGWPLTALAAFATVTLLRRAGAPTPTGPTTPAPTPTGPAPMGPTPAAAASTPAQRPPGAGEPPYARSGSGGTERTPRTEPPSSAPS